jgi:hypothetical protein
LGKLRVLFGSRTHREKIQTQGRFQQLGRTNRVVAGKPISSNARATGIIPESMYCEKS